MMDSRIGKYLSGDNVFVDLGCGSGEVLDALVGHYEELIGLDAFESRLKMRSAPQHGWEFRQADLNGTFPLPDNYADTVFANQVIEHIIDPYHFAREIYRVLRRGGRTIITTPNIRYIKNLWRIIVSGHGPTTAGGNTFDGAYDDGHLHYFTHADLMKVFSSSGFRKTASEALVDLSKGNPARRILDRWRRRLLVREFLSGNILLIADK